MCRVSVPMKIGIDSDGCYPYTISMKPPSTRMKTVIRMLCYCPAGLFLLLAAAAGGGAIWLWGWTWESTPNFHESWTEAERAALSDFEHYLRREFTADMLREQRTRIQACTGQERELSLAEYLNAVIHFREMAAPIADMLHDAAERGTAAETETTEYGDVHCFTPAILAAQTGHLNVLEVLVQHGANPNACSYIRSEFSEPLESETLLSPLLNGYFINGRRMPWESRRKTADFLLAHGAELNRARDIHGRSCSIHLILQEGAGADAPWQWALDNGLHFRHTDMPFVLNYAPTQNLPERILRENRINVNDNTGRLTLLQSLLRSFCVLRTEEEWQNYRLKDLIESRLALLLAAGEDPNLLPPEAEPQRPGESDIEFQKRCISPPLGTELPLDMVLRAYERSSSPAYRDTCERLISQLRAAGAR